MPHRTHDATTCCIARLNQLRGHAGAGKNALLSDDRLTAIRYGAQPLGTAAVPIYRLILIVAPMSALLVAALSVLAVEQGRERLDRSTLSKIAARPWADPAVTGSVTRQKPDLAHVARQTAAAR